MNKLQNENSILKQKIRTLNKIGLAFSNVKDTNELLQLVLKESMNITESDAGSIYLVEKESGKEFLKFKTSYNKSKDISLEGNTIDIDKNSATGYSAKSGDAIVINSIDNSNDKKFTINKSFDTSIGYTTNNMIIVPMKDVNDEVVGVIQLINKMSNSLPCDFDEDDKDLLLSIASQLAVTIDRIHTNRKLERNVSLTRTTLISFFNGMKQTMSTIGEDILEEQSQFKKFATYDPLTGLLTRKEGLSFLSKQIEFARFNGVKVVICFIDIDGLKHVNDNFGHSEGDFLIKSATDIIRNTARENDTMFRYGGDEFILVLYDINLKTASHVWNRIESKFYEFNKLSGKDYDISASIGYAEYNNNDKQSISELIKTADEQMYINKKTKKGLL